MLAFISFHLISLTICHEASDTRSVYSGLTAAESDGPTDTTSDSCSDAGAARPSHGCSTPFKTRGLSVQSAVAISGRSQGRATPSRDQLCKYLLFGWCRCGGHRCCYPL